MKKTVKYISFITLIIVFCLSFTSCSKNAGQAGLWDNAPYTEDTQLGSGEKTIAALWDDALYTEDTELGNGAKTIFVEVKVEDKSVTFTINTDKETVGEALDEHGLISGEKSPYGLYVKVVNGITADYDANQSYWAFNKNGEYMQTGVDVTEIADGEHYELVYTK